MSDAGNETLLESLFEQFLDQGHSEAEAAKLARERLYELPDYWS